MAKKGHPKPKYDPVGYLVAIIPGLLAIYLITLIPEIMHGAPLTVAFPWVTSLGIQASFLIDGLSLLFGLIITIIGGLVILYSGAYLAGNSHLKRFYVYILIFMIAMLGVVFSRNLVTLFVFWELTSISSFLLIGFYNEKEDSRKAALQALLVTGGGGLLLLVGILILGLVAGNYDLVVLFTKADLIQESPFYGTILILVLLGAFTKSAQFPFHFWLPGAMEAPAPVSAYLHSATMVKAGIYLIARMTPILGGTSLWMVILVIVGAVTMLLGAWMALGQTDLKRILAYSTVSVLGMLTFLLGLGSTLAGKASMVLLIAHALYKGTLFLSAGAVDHGTGTRDILQLGGLRRLMPLTATVVALAAFSQAGIPPLLGFVSKELLYETTLEANSYAGLLTGIALITSVILVAVAGVVAIRPFWGKLVDTPQKAHEAPWQMALGPLVLVSLSFILGLFPEWAGNTLIAAAVSAVRGETIKVKLSIWHGLTPMLILSLVTVGLGILLYVIRNPARTMVQRLDLGKRIGPARFYQVSLRAVDHLAEIQTRFIQNGSLPNYMRTVVVFTLALVGYLLLRGMDWDNLLVTRQADFRLYEVFFPIIILVAAVAVVRSTSRLAAVAALGVVGFGVAMLYVLYGAPDLAMTQFAIETLTVILFVLVLYRLPRFASYSRPRSRLRDALIAAFAGAMMTLLVLAVTTTPLTSRLSPYFADNSYLLAKGRNIVNVILVDFRGIDTLGEITVLAVAAIGVFALMKLRAEE
ncbi:putative monovalent cation/H+ antiporter subunit A [Chloroflexota bacterium]